MDAEGTVRQRSNGGWEVRISYVDPTTGDVSRQFFYCKTEDAARAKLDRARRQLETGAPLADADELNLREWVLPVAKGLASYIPGLYALRSRRRHQQSASARYCYDVWLRHLTALVDHSKAPAPRTLAELGPGGSLGVGIAAILSGVDTYYALDIVEYSEAALNLALLDELVELFEARTPVDMGWLSETREFPHHILSNQVLDRTLNEDRLNAVRQALCSKSVPGNPITIDYITPWNDPDVIRNAAVDLIISHSVLEHVDDLRGTYAAFAKWLRPGGYMSHLIDFTSHGLTSSWNGHWCYPELVWRAIVGNKPYLINREPYSTHVSNMKDRGFVLTQERRHRVSGLPREKLASQWRKLDDQDLVCASAFVQASLRNSP